MNIQELLQPFIMNICQLIYVNIIWMYLHKNVSEALNHKSHGVSGKSWPLPSARPEFKSHPCHSLCDFEKILCLWACFTEHGQCHLTGLAWELRDVISAELREAPGLRESCASLDGSDYNWSDSAASLFYKSKSLPLWGLDSSALNGVIVPSLRVLQMHWRNTSPCPHQTPHRCFTNASSFLSKSINPLQIITELVIRPNCVHPEISPPPVVSLAISNTHTHIHLCIPTLFSPSLWSKVNQKHENFWKLIKGRANSF